MLLLLCFFTLFQNPKKRDFLRFLPCFIRFLELWLLLLLLLGVRRRSPPKAKAFWLFNVPQSRKINPVFCFVLLYFRLSTLFDLYLVSVTYFPVLYLYWVSVCLFSCAALFVSISQVIGCEDRLGNDPFCNCVSGGVLNSTHSLTHSLCISVTNLSIFS